MLHCHEWLRFEAENKKMKDEKSAADHTLDVTLKRVDELHQQVEELKTQLLTKGNHKNWSIVEPGLGKDGGWKILFESVRLKNRSGRRTLFFSKTDGSFFLRPSQWQIRTNVDGPSRTKSVPRVLVLSVFGHSTPDNRIDRVFKLNPYFYFYGPIILGWESQPGIHE